MVAYFESPPTVGGGDSTSSGLTRPNDNIRDPMYPSMHTVAIATGTTISLNMAPPAVTTVPNKLVAVYLEARRTVRQDADSGLAT